MVPGLDSGDHGLSGRACQDVCPTWSSVLFRLTCSGDREASCGKRINTGFLRGVSVVWASDIVDVHDGAENWTT